MSQVIWQHVSLEGTSGIVLFDVLPVSFSYPLVHSGVLPLFLSSPGLVKAKVDGKKLSPHPECATKKLDAL